MNKSVFESLNKAQQEALMAGAKKAEAYYLAEAKKEDQASVNVFKKNGVEIKEMSADEFNAWRSIAKETSYKKFVSGYKDGQRLLDLALSVN
jgi:TRAP-type C4-dicarboxylate transport system substrate-binding protein